MRHLRKMSEYAMQRVTLRAGSCQTWEYSVQSVLELITDTDNDIFCITIHVKTVRK